MRNKNPPELPHGPQTVSKGVEGPIKTRMSVRLKKETASEHSLLEQTTTLRLLMSSALTIEAYIQVLHCWQQCWVPLEICFEASAPPHWGDSFRFPPRRHALNDDLKWLSAPELHSPSEVIVPVLDHHEWLGAAYVLKGAQLGSGVIAGHLYRHLGIRGRGVTFFQNQIVEAAVLRDDWNRWCERFDSIDLSDADFCSVADGARKIFRYLHKNFEKSI